MTKFSQHHCGVSCTDIAIAAANSAKASAERAEAAAETAAKDAAKEAAEAMQGEIEEMVQQQVEAAIDTTYLKKSEAEATYLKRSDAANTYVTKTDLEQKLDDVNSDLTGKTNIFSTTLDAFTQMEAQGQLQNSSFYVVTDNP